MADDIGVSLEYIDMILFFITGLLNCKTLSDNKRRRQSMSHIANRIFMKVHLTVLLGF